MVPWRVLAGPAQAQGLTATELVDGLSIPQVHGLDDGTPAFGPGNHHEPQSVVQPPWGVSRVPGVRPAPGLELSWRVAERSTRGASGRVLGLASQAAPAQVERIVLGAPKSGQTILTLRVSARAWRNGLHARIRSSNAPGNSIATGILRDFASAWDVDLNETYLALQPSLP